MAEMIAPMRTPVACSAYFVAITAAVLDGSMNGGTNRPTKTAPIKVIIAMAG